MNLLPLFQWFEATTLGTVVRESIWMFPVIECFHLLALALLGGTMLVVDLRTFGLGLSSLTAAELEGRLRSWMTGAWVVMIVTGVPMFLSEAIKCFYSPPFWWKIGLLVVATIFTCTWRRAFTRVTAVVNLALWFGVGFAGRWVAFY
jgi:hypothetical protein